MNAVVRRRGFTLMELIVVLAIIGLLIALLLPANPLVEDLNRKYWQPARDRE